MSNSSVLLGYPDNIEVMINSQVIYPKCSCQLHLQRLETRILDPSNLKQRCCISISCGQKNNLNQPTNQPTNHQLLPSQPTFTCLKSTPFPGARRSWAQWVRVSGGHLRGAEASAATGEAAWGGKVMGDAYPP